MKRLLGLLLLTALMAALGWSCSKEHLPAVAPTAVEQAVGPSKGEGMDYVDPPECAPDCGGGGGKPGPWIWVDESVIDGTSITGCPTAWNNLVLFASTGFELSTKTDPYYPTLFKKDSCAGALAMAKAIVFRRLDGGTSCTKSSSQYASQFLAALEKLMADSSNAEQQDCGDEILSVGRNLASWCIAADYFWDYMYNTYPGTGYSYRVHFADFVKSMTARALSDGGDCVRNDRSVTKDCYERANNWVAWDVTCPRFLYHLL